jgi:hypothetical protein
MPTEIPSKRPLPIIRVFVSSTFSDLKHERNALHAQVWPELERYCQQRGFTFQAIDLRWGVPAEAGLDHRTMRICFEELRRSQETSPEPNFLILLGNRYGWRPLPEVISVEEFATLKTAAEQIQSEPPDPAKQLTERQVELLKKSVAVLEDWYLLDENAKPFGEEFPIGEYVLRTRKTPLRGVDYGKETVLNDSCNRSRETSDRTLTSSATQDTAAWVDVQFVLWSIVNCAFPAADLANRFQTLHETSPGTVPSSVRFQASATEQEIWQGALQVVNADRHVIAAVREIDNLDAIPDTLRRGDFIDLKDDRTPDDDARQALADLKAELKRRLVRSPIIRSRCQWAIDKDKNPTGDVTTSHLDKFCRKILTRFKRIIINQIGAYWRCDLRAKDATFAQVRGSQQELDLECADHLRFAGERAPEKTFVGRESEQQRIRDYLDSETPQPFVVHGPSGSGKTALLGKIIQEVTPPRSADGTRAKTGPIVLSRFIGTTPESSNLRSLMSSLCRELRQDFEVTKTRETPDGQTETSSPPLPTDLNELIDEFYSQLGQATAARPVFVFLDALDQLDAADHGRSVYWIRSSLPSTTDASCHAWMTVSCLSPSEEFPEDSEASEPFRELKLRTLLGNHELGALDETDARQLFANWLRDARRSVSETQQDMIWSVMQKSSACRQPLFLKVLFEEARRWRSFDAPSAIPKSLAQLLDELFIRLGKPSEHGELIGIALSYLVAARYGLSEGELLEILCADPEYKAILAEDNKRNGHELPPNSNRIPIAPWTRLRSDLAPYLAERSAPGTAVMHSYHRQFRAAVKDARLKTDAQRQAAHAQLADYFRNLSHKTVHALVELPYQLAGAELPDQLVGLLSDIAYLDDRCARCDIGGLISDYDLLRDKSDMNTLAYRDFLRAHLQRLSQFRGMLFSLIHHEGFSAARAQARELVAQGHWKLPWIKTMEAWTPPIERSAPAVERLERITQFDFGLSAAVAVAEDRLHAYFVSKRGQIGIVDMRVGWRHPLTVSCRPANIVALFSRPDGQYLVVAFEDGTADVIHLGHDENAAVVAGIAYRVARHHPPVMALLDHDFLYQDSAGNLAALRLADGSTRIVLGLDQEHGAIGEMSGIARLNGSTVIGVRNDRQTRLLLVEVSGQVRPLLTIEVDVIAMSVCSSDRLAVAFADGTLAVFNTSDVATRVAHAILDELPRCLVCEDEVVTWTTSRGQVRKWHYHTSEPQAHMDAGGIDLRGAHVLALKGDGTMVAVTDTAAIWFRKTGQGVSAPHRLTQLLTAAKSNTFYAIQKRCPGLFLIDGLSQSVEMIEPNTDSPHIFALCAPDLFLGARLEGEGMLIDPVCKRAKRVSAIPPRVASIACETNHGFWYTTDSGLLGFVDRDGNQHSIGQVGLDDIRWATIRSIGDRLMWVGNSLDDGPTGQDRLFAAVFFEITDHQHGWLREIGQRKFAHGDGLPTAFAYDRSADRIISVWQNGRKWRHYVKMGSASDFMNRHESEHPLFDVDLDVSVATLAPDGDGIYLLSRSGNLFYVRNGSWRSKGHLSCSLPITHMSEEVMGNGSVVVVLDASLIYVCRYERSD